MSKKYLVVWVLPLAISVLLITSNVNATQGLWHESGVTSIALSPDERWLLSGSFDLTVRLWDFPSIKQMHFLFKEKAEDYPIDGQWPPPPMVMAVAFSPNNQFAAAGHRDRTIRIWEIRKKDHPIILRGHGGILALAFSPDSSLLVSGGHGPIVQLWDLKTKEQAFELGGHGFQARALGFTKDGQSLVSTSIDGNVRFWNVLTGELEKQIHLNCRGIYGFASSKDSPALAVGCGNGQIVTSSNRFQDRQILSIERGGSIYALALSSDGKFLVSGGEDRTIHLWDIETGKEIRRYVGHQSEVRSVVLSEDNRTIISASQDETIRIWNFETGEQEKFLGNMTP